MADNDDDLFFSDDDSEDDGFDMNLMFMLMMFMMIPQFMGSFSQRQQGPTAPTIIINRQPDRDQNPPPATQPPVTREHTYRYTHPYNQWYFNELLPSLGTPVVPGGSGGTSGGFR